MFFSDGSVSLLESDSQLTLNELNFPEWDNLSTIVKLSLWAGTIWTRATHLNDASAFEVYTSDSAAAVRWTIFWVIKNTTNTETIIVEWEIEVSERTFDSLSSKLEKWNLLTTENELKVEKWDSPKSIITENNDTDSNVQENNTDMIPYFSQTDNYERYDIRNETQITDNLLASCRLPNWEEIENWENANFYKKAIPNAWEDCESQYRECNDWELSWSYIFENCGGWETTCNFEVEWECLDEEELEWMSLIAYAPYKFNLFCASPLTPTEAYNKCQLTNNYLETFTPCTYPPVNCNQNRNKTYIEESNYLKMFTPTNIITTDSWFDWINEKVHYNSLKDRITNWKWVFIDNTGSSDYIKYTGLNLDSSDNYAIEISVKGSDLKRNDDTYVLLSTDWNMELATYYSEWEWEWELIIKKWSTNQYTNLLDSTEYNFNDNDFYTIRVINNSGKTKVQIESELPMQEIEISEVTNLSQLYIWSKNDFTQQWNGIIDYVKLYKD